MLCFYAIVNQRAVVCPSAAFATADMITSQCLERKAKHLVVVLEPKLRL